MADSNSTLEILPDYVVTNWYNYNPPSIDQTNLLNIEDNIKTNRDTINEIIRRVGVPPTSGTTTEDQKIYDTAIYDTLIDFRNQLTNLATVKLDKAIYLAERGGNAITDIKGSSTIIGGINNRLRKDTDDTSEFGYTFKRLTLTNDLQVGTTSLFKGNVTMSGTNTIAGLLTANGGLETTTLKATNAATLTNTLSVTGATTLNGGLTVKNGATIGGTLTVDSLVVKNGITVNSGNIELKNNGTISGYEITARRQVTINCENSGNLWIKKNYIEMGSSAEHRLWVQGANVSLRTGDALIKTVG